jgi:pyruvate formate lyase activating enzyme
MVMKIAGLQKVSTIDYPGEICCIVFLWGCNFRCGFCYNPELVIGKSEGGFSEEKVLEFLKKRIGKLDGVCITGGEPLISLDFDFVRKIKDMGFKIKVDSNGSFPERLREMVENQLVDYIAMDVKGAKEDYEKIAGVSVDIEKIEESIEIVNDFGGEFRTTVVPGLHDGEKLRKMGEWMGKVCRGKPKRIFLQGFKGGKGMIDPSFVSKDEVLEEELVRLKDGLRGLFGEVGIRV